MPTRKPHCLGLDLHTLEGMHQGSRTHCIELFSRVVRLLPDVSFVLFLDVPGCEPGLLERFAAANVRVVHMPHRSPVRRLLVQLPQLTRQHGVTLLHSQQITPPHLGVASLVTIHDVLFENYPQYFTHFFRLRSMVFFRLSAKRARHVFTVSQYSRGELMTRYRVPACKVTTIANGVNLDRFYPGNDGDEAVRALGLQPGKYLLSVGRLEPRKNYPALLRAMALMPEGGPRLVIVGQRDFRFQEVLKLRARLGLQREVLILEDVEDDLLPALYRHSLLFIYPTFAEGFGMPLLEAMASGVPVITSNTTSLPEIAGDAAYLVPPSDDHALRKAMQIVLASPALRADLRERGLRRVRQFSWEHSAVVLAKRYRAILGENA